MNTWKKEYEEIMVPDQMREKVELGIQRARQEKRRRKKQRMIRTGTSIAASLAILLILPNTSQMVAAAMQQIPLLGDFFKVVTIREYKVDTERYTADVEVQEVKLQEEIEKKSDVSQETLEQARKTADEINLDIQQVTDGLIEEFKRDMEEYAEGYQDLVIESTVLADTKRWFSLDLMMYQGAGSGYECHRHYTIDKTTGERATLAGLFGADYTQVISQSVKEQMRQRMAQDDSLTYWVDYEDVPAWNFQEIAQDQDFYVNEAGNAVICFDEYEVAPGYMGCVEFEVEVPQ